MLELFHTLPGTVQVVDRERWLGERLRGRDVLHVGAADAALLDDPALSGRWLHGLVRGVARSAVGVDLDAAAIAQRRRIHGLGEAELFAGDAEVLALGQTFDVVLFGEVIEHLPNPGRALARARDHLRPGGHLLVTTPNQYSWKMMRETIRGRELIHPEHLHLYSYRSLRQALDRQGFFVEEMALYHVWDPFPRGALDRLLVARWPFLADGLLFSAGSG